MSKRLALASLVALVLAGSLAACGASGKTVVITHGPAAAPVLVKGGVEGTTVGDVRYFSFPVTMNGADGRLDTVMATTGLVAGSVDEIRDARLIFTSADGKDQVIVERVAFYPGANSTLKVDSTTVGAVVGGFGAYAGATGWAESTHNADGSWTHTLHLQ